MGGAPTGSYHQLSSIFMRFWGFQMGVSIVMGVPRTWMVYFMENPNPKMDDEMWQTYDFGNLQMEVSQA